MKRLLIIAHAPSPNTQKLAEATLQGAKQASEANATSQTSQAYQANQNNQAPQTPQVILKSPADTLPKDVLEADGLILGTLENLGYMSGMTKDFFDRCYYPLLDKKQGMAYATYIRAGHDGTATKTALETINNGLRWHMVQEPLILRGEWSDDFANQVYELGMAMVEGMDMGIF